MNEMHTLQVNGQEFAVMDADARRRLTGLETGYRHIATYEHTAEECVNQIDITKDKDGNAFSCSDFLIYLTLPTSEDISTNYKTQLYIGHKMWENWELYMPQGFSTSTTRRMRLHLYHAFDGYWLTDGVYNDNIAQVEYTVPNINSTNSGFGNLKSAAATGKTISELHFYALSAFNKGTKIEIYGK